MNFEIDSKLFEVEEFFRSYLKLLINRLSNSVLSLEVDLGDSNASYNAVRLNSCMKAFEKLLTRMNTNLISEDLIVEVASTINESSMFISNGYRKVGKFLLDTDIPISKPNMIKADMLNLIYKYNRVWNELDYLEREARFHIAFIRIHPFEDGNGRTSRLLLNYNLLRQGKVPVIISLELLDKYLEIIKNEDVESLTELFIEQSKQELDVINYLYDEYKSENKHHRK